MRNITILVVAVVALAFAAPTVFAVGENPTTTTTTKTTTTATTTATKPAKAAKAKRPTTRQEDIQRVKDQLAKLEKMTDAEWTEKHQKKGRKGGKYTAQQRKEMKAKFNAEKK